MLRIIQSLLIFSLSINMLQPIPTSPEAEPIVEVVQETKEEVSDKMNIDELVVLNKKTLQISSEAIVVEEEPVYSLTEEEINLIALVTMAEAEGESEYGKRLVIDTILNRVDHEYSYWPDSVHDVVYQKGQFSSMWNGRVDKCYVREDIVKLVKEELVKRTNTEVVYFRMGKYSKYGTPAFKEGCHYFSNF